MPRALPEWLLSEMPYARRAITVDGVGLSVVDDGPRDAEETLVFLHGNPTWSYLWRKLLGPCREAGHRIVAPDMAGLGCSDKPRKASYHSLERHIQNLEAVAAELGLDDVTLVLHDWGGPIGMGWATRHMDLVKRIVITNTVAFAPSEERPLTKWHQWLASPIGFRLGVHLNAVEASAMLLGVSEPLGLREHRAYGWPMLDKGARVAAASLVRMVPDGPDHPTAVTLRQMEDLYPKLAQDTPVRVLWADKDAVMRPKFAARWKEAFPDAEVDHVSATGGHFWQEDDPEPFLREILAFVRG